MIGERAALGSNALLVASMSGALVMAVLRTSDPPASAPNTPEGQPSRAGGEATTTGTLDFPWEAVPISAAEHAARLAGIAEGPGPRLRWGPKVPLLGPFTDSRMTRRGGLGWVEGPFGAGPPHPEDLLHLGDDWSLDAGALIAAPAHGFVLDHPSPRHHRCPGNHRGIPLSAVRTLHQVGHHAVTVTILGVEPVPGLVHGTPVLAEEVIGRAGGWRCDGEARVHVEVKVFRDGDLEARGALVDPGLPGIADGMVRPGQTRPALPTHVDLWGFPLPERPKRTLPAPDDLLPPAVLGVDGKFEREILDLWGRLTTCAGGPPRADVLAVRVEPPDIGPQTWYEPDGTHTIRAPVTQWRLHQPGTEDPYGALSACAAPAREAWLARALAAAWTDGDPTWVAYGRAGALADCALGTPRAAASRVGWVADTPDLMALTDDVPEACDERCAARRWAGIELSERLFAHVGDALPAGAGVLHHEDVLRRIDGLPGGREIVEGLCGGKAAQVAMLAAPPHIWEAVEAKAAYSPLAAQRCRAGGGRCPDPPHGPPEGAGAPADDWFPLIIPTGYPSCAVILGTEAR